MSEKLHECLNHNLLLTAPGQGVLEARVAGDEGLVVRVEVREDRGRPALYVLTLRHEGVFVQELYAQDRARRAPERVRAGDRVRRAQEGQHLRR